MPGTRKLGRRTDQRDAMLRCMVTALFKSYDPKEGTGHICTTVTRAKEVRSLAEKYLTIAKTNNLANYRRVIAYLHNADTKGTERYNEETKKHDKSDDKLKYEDIAKKLFDEIAPRYADVNGGYTRITRIGQRRGDAAEMALLEFVPIKKAEAARAERKRRVSRRKKAAAE